MTALPTSPTTSSVRSRSARRCLGAPAGRGVLTLSRPPKKATTQATITRFVARRIRLPQPKDRTWSQRVASSSAVRQRPVQVCRIVPIMKS